MCSNRCIQSGAFGSEYAAVSSWNKRTPHSDECRDTLPPDSGHPLLQKLIDSIENIKGVACFDYSAMYAVRDVLRVASTIPEPDSITTSNSDSTKVTLGFLACVDRTTFLTAIKSLNKK